MRLDAWLIENGYAENEFMARGLVMGARVLVNDALETRPGYNVKVKDIIRVKASREWVARSAQKLLAALDEWKFEVKDKTFADFGASHGGFTQVLLEKGAKKIAAVDVAYGIFDSVLRNNPRVILFERTHVCEMTIEKIGFLPDYFVCDLSFISLRKVLDCIKRNFTAWEGIALFKPQFEAKREELVKGIVKNDRVRDELLNAFENYLRLNGIENLGRLDSPVAGAQGNRETLFHLKWNL